MAVNWIELDGLANMRDVGGIPTTDGGRIRSRQLLRSDNLQTLTSGDIRVLHELGLSDVIDLRSSFEVATEGDGPLVGDQSIRFHHHSFFVEQDTETADDHVDEHGADLPEPHDDPRPETRSETTGALPGEALPGDALPWVGLEPAVKVDDAAASTYLSFLADRPDSVIGALRAVAGASGAALVHCAAGKDRTGTTVALALTLAGAERDAVVADYAASNERMQRIVDRLLATTTYHDNLVGRPLSSHATRPETMDAFLRHAEESYGGVEQMLAPHGWTSDDTARMRTKLRG